MSWIEINHDKVKSNSLAKQYFLKADSSLEELTHSAVNIKIPIANYKIEKKRQTAHSIR